MTFKIRNTTLFRLLRKTKVRNIYILLRDFISILTYFLKRVLFLNKIKKPNVLSIEKTIDLLVSKKVSVSRYGDGEFRWMSNIANENSFQHSSQSLAQRLNEVMNSKNTELLICIPDVFESLDAYTYNDTAAWSHLLLHYYKRWIKIIGNRKLYGDANFTRPYIDRKNKNDSIIYFDSIKKVWDDKIIVIVEGEYTGFGVGNDLLSNARSVKRIICPAVNAFDKYEEIYNQSLMARTGTDLYLLALGPTATVLASDLCESGIQSIDIGHLDIEYDWYRMHVNQRVPIKGKYVNEVHQGGRSVVHITDQKYLSEIISKIY